MTVTVLNAGVKMKNKTDQNFDSYDADILKEVVNNGKKQSRIGQVVRWVVIIAMEKIKEGE